jgi:hypothetical protein
LGVHTAALRRASLKVPRSGGGGGWGIIFLQ